MRFFGWAVLLLALLEVVSIVLVSDWIGGGATLLLMLLGFGIGVLMLRHLGFSAVLLAGAAVRKRQPASLYQLLWPIRFVLAALLLMSPGFASDACALLLMLPLKGKAFDRADFDGRSDQAPFAAARGRHNAAAGDIIEGEYTVSDEAQASSERLPPTAH